MKEKIDCIIVGGSIAGCVTAILLSRLGMRVTILERSSGGLKEQGAGITLPISLVDKCIALDLFDKTIPRLPIKYRSFFRKSLLTHDAEKIGQQPLNIYALNWMDVYCNLRKRLHDIDFCSSVNVKKIQKKTDSRHYLETTSGMFDADMIIAADGVRSTIRKEIFPENIETYGGYIAWRGVLEITSFESDEQLPYYVFPNGHILFYRIPADSYEKTGKTLLNWVMYEVTPSDILPSRLIDHKNIHHTHSIPQKTLHEDQRQYLHDFANQQLPPKIAKIIYDTPHPFIQVIFDAETPLCEDNQIIFMGDAATTLRPHSGSGAMKALKQAIDLYELINKDCDGKLDMLLSQWKVIQQKNNAEEIARGKTIGKALVTETPLWQDMNQETLNVWWSQVMKPPPHYTTQPFQQASLSIFLTHKPEENKKEESLLQPRY